MPGAGAAAALAFGADRFASGLQGAQEAATSGFGGWLPPPWRSARLQAPLAAMSLPRPERSLRAGAAGGRNRAFRPRFARGSAHPHCISEFDLFFRYISASVPTISGSQCDRRDLSGAGLRCNKKSRCFPGSHTYRPLILFAAANTYLR